MDTRRPPLTRVFVNVVKELDVLEARIIQRLVDEDAITEEICFLSKSSMIDWRTEFSATSDQFIIAANNLSKLCLFSKVIFVTDRQIERQPIPKHQLIGSLKLDDYYECSGMDDKHLPYLMHPEINKVEAREMFAQDSHDIFEHVSNITITEIAGTINMLTLGRELLRALSLANEPVRDPDTGSKRHEPPKVAASRRRRRG